MTSTWILVSDGSHARIFQSDDAAQPWRAVTKLDREHSHEKTDRTDSHEDHGEHGFARQLVAELETGRQKGTFTRLVLVAPPKFLGHLREELHPSLATCVARSIDKDYAQMSESDLVKHVDLS